MTRVGGTGTTLPAQPERILRERILRLAAGEDAPAGMEILRLLGTFERIVGTGTNTEIVYVVAVRPASDARADMAASAATCAALSRKVADGSADAPEVEALALHCGLLAKGLAA